MHSQLKLTKKKSCIHSLKLMYFIEAIKYVQNNLALTIKLVFFVEANYQTPCMFYKKYPYLLKTHAFIV